MSHKLPVQPELQVQTLFAVHVPWSHAGLHTAETTQGKVSILRERLGGEQRGEERGGEKYHLVFILGNVKSYFRFLKKRGRRVAVRGGEEVTSVSWNDDGGGGERRRGDVPVAQVGPV